MSVRMLYFLRHGETEMNRQHRAQGRIDIPLNGEGVKQAGKAAENLRGKKIDRIYASPLTRAVESARPIAEERGLEILTLEWLQEIDHGGLEGMNEKEAEEKYPGLLSEWLNSPDTIAFPGGGETVQDVAMRLKNGLLELLENEEAENILFVTHQVISGIARCIFRDLPLSKLWEDKLVNGDYIEFEIDGLMIDRLNNFETGSA